MKESTLTSRQFAQIFGTIYLIVGILGFIPSLVTSGALLGIFPINYLHDCVHIILGIWGLASAGSMARAVLFARAFAVILLVLGIYGLFGWSSPLPTDSLVPLGGNDSLLHLASGVIAAYFGWGAPSKALA
jgi:hypothetical protein